MGIAEARAVADGIALGAAVGAADGAALADVAGRGSGPGTLGGGCSGFVGSVALALALGMGGRDCDAGATGISAALAGATTKGALCSGGAELTVGVGSPRGPAVMINTTIAPTPMLPTAATISGTCRRGSTAAMRGPLRVSGPAVDFSSLS